MEVKENYYLGIDVGGTDIKYAVVSDKDCIIHSNSLPTDKTSEKSFLIQIENIVNDVRKDYLILKIGMGIPGNVSTKKGTVEFSANLPFRNTNVAGYLSERLGMNVKIAKDANCAAIAQITSEAVKQYENIIVMTLGTGIGGGLILNRKLYTGRDEKGGEIGHIITHANGIKCNCGQYGCFEKYASVSALVNNVKEYILENPNSILANVGTKEINGKTPFIAMEQGCDIAKKVIDNWVNELAIGINSLDMIFSPDVFVLSGAIIKDGDKFIPALKDKCRNKNIIKSEMGSKAGVLGAAMLQYKELI